MAKINLHSLSLALMMWLSVSTFTVDAKQATVYRCDRDGVVIFSQTPCANDAKTVEVKPSQGPGLSKEQAAKASEANQKALEDYLKTQDTEAKIAEHYRQIDKLKTGLKTQLAAMKEIRYRSEKARDEAYEAVEKHYQAQVRRHHEAIKQLHQSALTKQ